MKIRALVLLILLVGVILNLSLPDRTSPAQAQPLMPMTELLPHPESLAISAEPDQTTNSEPASRPAALTVDLLKNGNFELGNNGNWSTSSTTARTLIRTTFVGSVTPHAGSYAAWLGGRLNEDSRINQTINPLPQATSLTLTYWYWIASADPTCSQFSGDVFDIGISFPGGASQFETKLLCTSENTNGWVKETLNLNQFLGNSSLTIYFDVSTNSSNNSNFFLDDISLIATGVAPPSLGVSPTSLTFNATAGGFVPNGQDLFISKGGYGSFNWTASARYLNLPVGRIVLNPTSGTNSGIVRVTVNPLNLAPGLYNGYIDITAPGAQPSSRTTSVALNLTPPTLQVNPASLNFNAVVAGSNPANQTLNVSFGGAGQFRWTATPTAGWLSVSPTTGTNAGTVTVSVNISGLSAGTYSGGVIIDPENPYVNPQTIPVTLTISPGNPVLVVSPTNLTFSGLAGGDNPARQTLSISNGGDGILDWSISTTTGWLILRKANGQAPDTVGVVADITGLNPGTHSGQITVSGSNGQSRSVSVTLTLGQQNSGLPLLQVSPPLLDFAATIGGVNPAAQTFTINNLGGGTLNWTASSDASWLTLNSSSGVAPATLNASVNISGLPPGMHTGQITINGNSGQGSPQLVNVILALRLPPTLAIDNNILIFNSLIGQGNLSAQNFVVRNSGEGTFNWTANESIPWLSLDKTNGAAPATVSVSSNPGGLNVGLHAGAINVGSSTAAGSPREVSAKLYLRQGATLGTYPQAIHFDMIAGEGNPNAGSIEIQNVSYGTLNWKASEDIPWLTLSQTSGAIPNFTRNPAKVSINANNLQPKETPYTGQITVSSDNGQASPQTINVTLTVASRARYCRIPNGGSDYIIQTTKAVLKLQDVTITPTSDGGCDLRGKLVINLPQNQNLVVSLSGHVTPENRLTATATGGLLLKIANLELSLAQSFTVDDEIGLKAPSGTWKLPDLFGGRSQSFSGEIRISSKGLSIAGQQRFDLPDFNWGVSQFTKNKAEVKFSTDDAYLLEVTSEVMKIKVSGSNTVNAENVKLELNDRGIRSGNIGFFEVNGFAGLNLQVFKASIENNRLKAQEAKLEVPSEWGGATVGLYQLTINKGGSVNIGGGSFRLPEIDAGGTKISSLAGSIASRPGGGYEISAEGTFGMPAFESAGSCSITVKVTLYTGSGGATILEMTSLDNNQTIITTSQGISPLINHNLSATSLQLREATVGMRCLPGIAIGTTSFFITGVEGTITLSAGIDRVSLKLWIEHSTRIANKALISAVPQVTIRPKPFQMDFEGAAYIVGQQVSNATATINSKMFKAGMTLNYIVIYGGMTIEAGPGYMNGSGWAEIRAEKGVLFHQCTPFGCLDIPDSTQRLARADAYADLNHVEGSVSVAGFRASFDYDFASNRVSFSGVSRTASINSAEIQQARQTWQALQEGQLKGSGVDNRFTFEADGGVLITMPFIPPPPTTPVLQTTDVISNYPVALQSDIIFAMIQPPNGQLSFTLIAPPNDQEISPNNLPANVNFNQTIGNTEIQSAYTVQQAAIGNWKVKISGDTANTPFFVTQMANTPPPVLANLSITSTGNPDQINVNWRLTAAKPDTRVNIYVNGGPVTTTVTYTNPNGTITTGTTNFFAGNTLVKGLTSATNGSAQTYPLNLKQLPSGSYSFWLEADDGTNAPVRGYLQQGSQVAKIIVNHSASFPTAWTTQINTTTDIKQGHMVIEWNFNTHPDVDSYQVHIRTTDPLSPTSEIIRLVEAGKIGQGSQGKTILDNVEPGQTYRISIGAEDLETSRIAWSQERIVATSQPDFILSTSANNLKVTAGGAPLAIPLNLELASDLPYPVQLAVDFDRLPDGLDLIFDDDIIVSTAQAIVFISATKNMPAGYYAAPILAKSGTLQHDLTLTIQVETRHEGTGAVYLPIIFNNIQAKLEQNGAIESIYLPMVVKN